MANLRNQPTAQTLISMDSDFSGITACSAVGTPQAIAAVQNEGGFWLKGHPDNTDTVWIFFTGQTKASGVPLNSGEVAYVGINDLALLQFDADVTAEKICWWKA